MTSGTMPTITMVHYVDVDGTRVLGSTEQEANKHARALALAVIKAAIDRADGERAEIPMWSDNDGDIGPEVDAIIALARGYMGPDTREMFDAMTPHERLAQVMGWA